MPFLLYGVLLVVVGPLLAAAGECDCTSWSNCNTCKSWQIVNAMAGAPTDKDIQDNGCWALYWRPPEEVISAGGLKSVIAAMDALPDEGRVQQRAVVTLGKLSDNGRKDASGFSQADKVAEAGGIPRILNAMAKILGHADKDLAAEVNWHGCYALASLSKNEQHQAVVEAGAIQSVLTAMTTFPLEEGIPVNGCHMLYILADLGFREQVSTAGAAAAAKEAMAAIPGDQVRDKCGPLQDMLSSNKQDL